MITTGQSPYGADAGTEALLHLDEAAGEPTAEDSSGNDHDGTVTGATFTEQRFFGGAGWQLAVGLSLFPLLAGQVVKSVRKAAQPDEVCSDSARRSGG